MTRLCRLLRIISFFITNRDIEIKPSNGLHESIMSEATSLLSKRFRGALIGVLVGDCYGRPFERYGIRAKTVIKVNPTTVLERIDSMSNLKEGHLSYTDDTVMTKSTCFSLIENKGLEPGHLAKEFSESYFKEPKRGYGPAVRTVFRLLQASKYQDPYGPAANQFDGSGSYGNGAAMRCMGIALFACKNKLDDKQTVELCENCSKITHSHIYGIHGATLLVMAARYVLELDEDGLDENNFLDHLIQHMSQLEDPNDQVFTDKLKLISGVIERLSVSGTDVTQTEIVGLLGNDVSAQKSVPLAIYSFLRGNSKFTDSYRIENEFKRTLHWAISCGGDTDTIASMACGLSGAYLGVDRIPEDIYNKCEAYEEMLSLADKLYEL